FHALMSTHFLCQLRTTLFPYTTLFRSPDFNIALEKINDLIGVRAICAYVDDIYKVAALIERQKDIRIIKTKDYIREPKKSGYQRDQKSTRLNSSHVSTSYAVFCFRNRK